jgi:hypothetical protein
MRHNGLPVLLASKDLKLNEMDLREGWRPLVACRQCLRFIPVKRGMVTAHRLYEDLRPMPAGRSYGRRYQPGRDYDLETVRAWARDTGWPGYVPASTDVLPDAIVAAYLGRSADRLPRCPGSGQRIRIDLTPEQWRESLAVALPEVNGRRSAQVTPKPKPQPARAAHQIAADRQARPARASRGSAGRDWAEDVQVVLQRVRAAEAATSAAGCCSRQLVGQVQAMLQNLPHHRFVVERREFRTFLAGHWACHTGLDHAA